MYGREALDDRDEGAIELGTYTHIGAFESKHLEDYNRSIWALQESTAILIV